MQIDLPPGLSVGRCPGSVQPPALCGAFFVKASFRLRHDEPPVPEDEPELVTGDRHDAHGRLVYPSDFALFKPRADLIVVAGGEALEGAAIEVGAFSKSCEGPLSALGPVPPGAPERQRLTGRYDDLWLRERWPWFPTDFDWGYFNAAPRDQQIDGHLRGDEALTLHHLVPGQPLLRTRLPGLRMRCVVTLCAGEDQLRYRDVPMRLDTLWIDADAARLVLVWRGMTRILTPRMREVQRVVIVSEALSAEPRPAADYLALESSPAPAGFDETEDDAALAQRSASLDDGMAEVAKDLALHETELAEAQASLLALAETTIADAQRTSDARPTAALQVPDGAEGLSAADRAAMDRLNHEAAEMERTAAALDDEQRAREWTRERVAAAAGSGVEMTDVDLRGLDLSGLDLSGRDLSGSVLHGACLAGCRLAGTRFVGADLSDVQLSQADLRDAVLDGADLSGAQFDGAQLKRVSIEGTRLAGLDLTGADLSGCRGRQANVAGARLAGACFAGAMLASADFSDSVVDRANFAGAQLRSACFDGASARQACFDDADAGGLCADEASDFRGSSFRHLRGERLSIEGARLDGCDFRGASLKGAQFDGASLHDALFDRADLADALFDDADLTRASLREARLLRTSLEGVELDGADAAGARLFETGLWRATGAGEAFATATHSRTLLDLHGRST